MQSQGLKKLNIPDKPGIYRFLKGKEILYIGKATSLKDRVKSYFSKDLIATRGPLILDMVFQADDITWTETDSVLEALILEAQLIKEHQPKYNTKEKDDKSFNFVCISKDEIPKVLIRRGKDLKKQDFDAVFGPFTSGGQLKIALQIIRKIFPYLDDKSKNYTEFYKQINLVPNLSEKKKYLRNIGNIKLFFSGNKQKILKDLEKLMKTFAKEQKFEQAGEIKKQIFALKHINDVALIKEDISFAGVQKFSGEQNESSAHRRKLLHASFRIEAYDIAHMSGKNMVGVMTVVLGGEIDKSEYKKFKIKTQSGSNDTGALREVLERRFAHPEWRYPNLIVVDGSTAQINIAEKVLKQSGIVIPVLSVVKDERHKARGIKGDQALARKYEREILLVNSEAHRFAIGYHKQKRNKEFLK